jgi:hypothetical protein
MNGAHSKVYGFCVDRGGQYRIHTVNKKTFLLESKQVCQ